MVLNRCHSFIDWTQKVLSTILSSCLQLAVCVHKIFRAKKISSFLALCHQIIFHHTLHTIWAQPVGESFWHRPPEATLIWIYCAATRSLVWKNRNKIVSWPKFNGEKNEKTSHWRRPTKASTRRRLDKSEWMHKKYYCITCSLQFSAFLQLHYTFRILIACDCAEERQEKTSHKSRLRRHRLVVIAGDIIRQVLIAFIRNNNAQRYKELKLVCGEYCCCHWCCYLVLC